MDTEDKKLLKKFGENIKTARKKLNLTQEGLALKANIERSYMGTIERGERNPTLLKVHRIAKALGTSLSELI